MRNSKAIRGKGHFVATLSGLATGDMSVFDEYNSCDGKRIFEILSSLSEAGLHRVSGKGWNTVDHPALGLLQWRYHVDMATINPVWVVRLNGHDLLRAGPALDRGHTHIRWVGKASLSSSHSDYGMVTEFLGTVEDGMTRRHPWRWRHYPEAS